ncbi:MAG: alkaline phosphatase PhoX, partial [Byssovorax sp.]
GDPGDKGDKGDKGDEGGSSIGAKNLPELVKDLVGQYAAGTLPGDMVFPVPAAATDSLRALRGASANVVVSWTDPLTFDGAASAPHFGANADYIAYLGDGWDAASGNAPQWNGSSTSAWMWVNHEYISGTSPSLTAAPTSQHLRFAKYLAAAGILGNDVTANGWPQASIDTYIQWYKKQVGGTWMRIVQDPSTGEWAVDRTAANRRYDATSATLTRIVGQAVSADHDDLGAPLPAGVTTGIMADCAGGLTPWGTVITAEENVQDFYGDLETAWSSQQKLIPGQGMDPGADVTALLTPSSSSEFGRASDPNQSHARDLYGYLAEIDPGKPSAEHYGATKAGDGHKKWGWFGRARWEAATFAVDLDWKLVPNKPIVAYGADDRRGGRIYKYVSSGNYTAAMTRAEMRDLLDTGKLYVAHYAGLDNTTGNTLLATKLAPTEAAPGTGSWIELYTGSTAIAPNAAALGAPTKTVGEALKDVSWNGLGGFANDDAVRRSLFSASAKIGVMELNRPEDIEYNPRDASGKPRVYVTFTNHNRGMQLAQNGTLETNPNATKRADLVGAIFAMEEADTASPGASTTFKYFEVWHGSQGKGDLDAANPDNLLIDHQGGVWFGTDGNFGLNAHADAIYYLDLDKAHGAGMAGVVNPSFGRGFRVAAVPSDAEASGPTFSADMRTLFFSVQHPGEESYSKWPEGGPLSSVVALNLRP